MAKRERKIKEIEIVEPNQNEVVEPISEIEQKIEVPTVENKHEERVKEVPKEIIPIGLKKVTVIKPIRWKKVGGGTFLFKNHYIKPNQIFTAYLEEIPVQFRDLVVPLDDVISAEKSIEYDSTQNYHLEEDESGGWNIVNSSGKKLNEVPITYEIADRILNSL